MGFKGQIGLQFGGELKNREGRRREEEEEEEKKKRREEESQAKVWNFVFFCMETNLDHGIEWIYETLRLCMIKSLSSNLGFC